MPYRGDHILANAEPDDGIIFPEQHPRRRVLRGVLDRIVGLAEPQVAEREGLVPRELPFEIRI
jgi:hypothetical protein